MVEYWHHLLNKLWFTLILTKIWIGHARDRDKKITALITKSRFIAFSVLGLGHPILNTITTIQFVKNLCKILNGGVAVLVVCRSILPMLFGLFENLLVDFIADKRRTKIQSESEWLSHFDCELGIHKIHKSLTRQGSVKILLEIGESPGYHFAISQNRNRVFNGFVLIWIALSRISHRFNALSGHARHPPTQLTKRNHNSNSTDYPALPSQNSTDGHLAFESPKWKSISRTCSRLRARRAQTDFCFTSNLAFVANF